MTVQELIEKLQTLPPDAKVQFQAYNPGHLCKVMVHDVWFSDDKKLAILESNDIFE
jgi:hypothetical protein